MRQDVTIVWMPWMGQKHDVLSYQAEKPRRKIYYNHEKIHGRWQQGRNHSSHWIPRSWNQPLRCPSSNPTPSYYHDYYYYCVFFLSHALFHCLEEIRLRLCNTRASLTQTNQSVVPYPRSFMRLFVSLRKRNITIPQFEVVGEVNTGRMDYAIRAFEDLICIT